MGEQCFCFEAEFAKWQGRDKALFFNSGGSANLALIQALLNMGMLNRGDMVGFSAVTWSTNIMPLVQLGLHPIPVDCSISSLNISPNTLTDTLKDYPIKVLFLTNTLGFSDNIEEIASICKRKNILLLEDNCESLGSEFNGKKLGNFGLASTFSFFVSHHMPTIEGGMICTDNAELCAMLKMVRANGWNRNLDSNEQSLLPTTNSAIDEFDSKYTFYDLGFNLRPTELAAVIGRTQIKLLDASIEKRAKTYEIINKVMANNSELMTLKTYNLNKISNFAIPIVAKNNQLRRKYIEKLTKMEVEIRPLIAGNIQTQPFYTKYQLTKRVLPEADFIHGAGLYCGNHPDYSDSDIEYLSEALSEK